MLLPNDREMKRNMMSRIMTRRYVGMTLLLPAVLFLMVACKKEKENPSFDSNLLLGKWVSGSEFYRYDSDSTGVYWDTADDVHEEEAQPFKWSYDDEDNSLTHIHWMEMTQDWTVPRVYTVVTLNDSCLVYKDKSGKSYSFTKIK